MNESRRSWMHDISAWLLGGAAAGNATPAAAEPCITPAYAGFDGSFILNRGRCKIRLARAYVDHPGRWTIATGMLGVWRNRDDSVSKVVYRNRDGKLFSLAFVPMEEPA